MGSTVIVKKGDTESRYTIVGSYEAKPEEGKISDESPLGHAFMNHKVGDTVTITIPSGQETYRIIKVE